MRDLVVLAAGMVIGNWGPPLLAWLLTRTERNDRRVRRQDLERLVADVHGEPAGGLALPRQYAGHYVRGDAQA